MDRKLLIKILEVLERAYPSFCYAEKLRKIVKMPTLNGEFFKVIKYLKDTHKIIHVLWESKLAPSQRDEIAPRDEITIKPDGIDFLNKLRLIESREKMNLWVTAATIVIAVSTLANLIYFALR